MNITIEKLCNNQKTKAFIGFAQSVFDLHFAEKPKYDNLRDILISIMTEGNVLDLSENETINTLQPSLSNLNLIKQ